LRKTIHAELPELRADCGFFSPGIINRTRPARFYPSPFDEAAILTIDGVGEWATTTISHGRGKDIKMLKELRFRIRWTGLFVVHGLTAASGQFR